VETYLVPAFMITAVSEDCGKCAKSVISTRLKFQNWENSQFKTGFVSDHLPVASLQRLSPSVRVTLTKGKAAFSGPTF
jgi:hypothetical protein